MRKSKSTANQPKKNNNLSSEKHRRNISVKKQWKLDLNRNKKVETECLTDNRNVSGNGNIDKRIYNIKKGLQTLESHLKFDITPNFKDKEEIKSGKSPSATQKKKESRRLFNDSVKSVKKRKCYTSSHNSIMNKQRNTARNKQQKYHSCVYEESLMTLMKIVTLQKYEIERLKHLKTVRKS